MNGRSERDRERLLRMTGQLVWFGQVKKEQKYDR